MGRFLTFCLWTRYLSYLRNFTIFSGMIQKYVSVLQRYFIQFLSGFDVTVLKEVVQVGLNVQCHVTFDFIVTHG